MTNTQTVIISEYSLEGDLAIPIRAKAIVIFAHGAGSSRYSTRNQYIAKVLNESGFATLLVDLLTVAEKKIDDQGRHLRFDMNLLTNRFMIVTNWVQNEPETSNLKMGYFGASTGAAAAIIAASSYDNSARAIVSRGGRPDLVSNKLLSRLTCPILFIVGGNDSSVLGITADAIKKLSASKHKELVVIPRAGHLFEEQGKMEQVAQTTVEWFRSYLLDDGKKFDSAYTQKRSSIFSLKERFNIKLRFKDRTAAGAMLASILRKHRKDNNVIILGIPRGGVVVADAISRMLHADFDIIFPRKLRSPDNPESAIGAIMQDGSVYIDANRVKTLEISHEYLELEKSEQVKEIYRRKTLYRPSRKDYNITSRTVILVDDGAATGSTVIAAAKWIRKQKPRQLIIALPVAPKDVASSLKNEADHLEILRVPSNFETVAQFYNDYADVTDDLVIKTMQKYLNQQD